MMLGTGQLPGPSIAYFVRFGIMTQNTKDYLLQFFEYKHLPEHLQSVSRPFGELAEFIATLPDNPEKTTALRKLLEAKDCAVRARLFR